MKAEETKLLGGKSAEESKEQYDSNLKVVMIGDINVGKSSIIDAFIHE